MRDVYVVGGYTTAFKKHPGISFGHLAGCRHANGRRHRSGWLGNCGMGVWGQNMLAELAMQLRGEARQRQVKGA